MAYQTLLYTQENNIGVVTINRPQAANALNDLAYAELFQVFQEIENDPGVRVVIITGSGEKSFVAGTDITNMAKLSAAEARAFSSKLKKTYDLIWNLDKPVIAAVNGYALGGGAELAMSADIVLASENARFGQLEINVGIIPGSGGTQRLQRLIGINRAKELIYTGKMIDAETAFEYGIVNKIVPLADLMKEAKTLAETLLTKSSAILKLAKSAINMGGNVDLNTGLNIEIECFAQCFATEDQKESMAAFLEKRKPVLKNK
ncbi:MAG TPA: enoyl-CoA hydratase-related protein [Dehalococcoidales bacterium]